MPRRAKDERAIANAEGDATPSLAGILATNLNALMARTKGLPGDRDLSSNPKLDEMVKLGVSAISRLRTARGNATLQTLEKLAAAFDMEPWHLLVPGLDPEHAPALQPLSTRERALYERWKEVAKELVGKDQA